MYRTSLPCKQVGRFAGPMVVSMRPIPKELILQVMSITSMYPNMHGGPIQIGNPEDLGILDLSSPDYGDPVPIGEHEVPFFGHVELLLRQSRFGPGIPFMITHAPGCMFITDQSNDALLNGTSTRPGLRHFD